MQALDELGKVFGDRLLTAAGAMKVFESDGVTALSARPRAVVLPLTEAEIIAAVRWCFRHEVPWVARGSGTSLSGGSVPVADGLVISVNRMNRCLRIDPDRRLAIVQPGMINARLAREAARFGLHYAPDPSSMQVCTIGGNLAFNSGGAHCLKYGMTTNHILGCRVVLADGELVTLGGESLEGEGADTLGLFCGSEGTMGIATEITVRLVPPPEAFYCVLAGYSDVEQAGEAVASIIASGLLPGAMEIMDAMAMRAAREGVGATYPPGCDAVLIVELDGSAQSVEASREKLDELLRQSGAIAIRVAASAAERLAIWTGRKSVFSAVGRLSPDFIVQDGVVPRSRLGYALRKIGEISRETGIPVANVFHAGDGNLHPLIMYDGRLEGALHRAEQVAARIVRLCIELGGSITGEHGVGLEKRDFLPEMFDEASLDAMSRVRIEMDPKTLANRGKMFPSGEGEPTGLYGLHPLEKSGVISRF
ncbi:MAG: FAD-binding protein [Planctomycetaceae bacterium]|nr:MAG: FAD-binding protein [Planctomycetaceae bacterium]